MPKKKVILCCSLASLFVYFIFDNILIQNENRLSLSVH